MKSRNRQSGVSLLGLLIGLAFLGAIVVVVAKVFPAVSENHSIDRAIAVAVNGSVSVPEVRSKFDKNAETGYIDTISGKDLDVEKQPDGTYVASYSYTKKIPLGGPVSLVIDFVGSSKGS